MQRRQARREIAFLCGVAFTAAVAPPWRAPVDEGWPQWGGPERTGVTNRSDWRPDGRVIWVGHVGRGRSSLVVRDRRVYTLGYEPDPPQNVLYCLDAETGAEVWRYGQAAKARRADEEEYANGTLSTPAVDEERVYSSDVDGSVRCFRASDGELLWQLDGKKKLKLDAPRYGFAASPVLLGERVILNLGRVFAFDRATGRTQWKSGQDYGDAYSTPIDFALDEKTFLAVFAADGLAVLALEDGKEWGFVPWKARDDVCAMTPVVIGGRVFVSTGDGRGCALIDFATRKPKTVWERRVMSNRLNGALHWDGHLYGFDDGILECIDLEGNLLWRERDVAGAALSIAGGRLLFGSKEGELVIAEASPRGYRELSRSRVLEGATWAFVPALVEGKIYLRDLDGGVAALDHRIR